METASTSTASLLVVVVVANSCLLRLLAKLRVHYTTHAFLECLPYISLWRMRLCKRLLGNTLAKLRNRSTLLCSSSCSFSIVFVVVGGLIRVCWQASSDSHLRSPGIGGVGDLSKHVSDAETHLCDPPPSIVVGGDGMKKSESSSSSS
jgi:hypothetical protein